MFSRAFIAIVISSAAPVLAQTYQADVRAAQADFQSYAEVDRAYIRYLSTHTIPTDIPAEAVQAFWLPHLSAETILQRQIPQRVGDTKFFRIDLRDLGWTVDAWLKLGKEYPYAGGYENPLFVRVDWLIWITSDTANSTLYYDLLYAETGAPKNREEFLERWRVDLKDADGFEQAIVIDEGSSGVALRTRLVVRRQTPAGYYWETFDSEIGEGENDPLEHLGGGLKYDAQELIASIPKIDLVTGERGAAQAYLLTDGAGNRVEEASARIVVDSSDRIPLIRTPGSCIRCHSTGLLNLPRNLVRELVTDGVEIYSKDKQQAEAIERLYLGKLDKELTRNQEDFAAFVASVCDLEPVAVTKAYADVLGFYEANVSLEQAAIELAAVDADELRNAIAYYAEAQGQAAPRLAMLAHGKDIPRRIWEADVYDRAKAALKLWRDRP